MSEEEGGKGRPSWTNADYRKLILDNSAPSWWKSNENKITYNLFSCLHDICLEEDGKIEDLMRSALLSLDKSSSLPSKISNLKKSVDRFLKKESSNPFDTLNALYQGRKNNFIGKSCSFILNIDKDVLDNSLLNDSNPLSKFSDKFLTNGIVIELVVFKNNNAYSIEYFKTWLSSLFTINCEISSKALFKKAIDLFTKKRSLCLRKKNVELEQLLLSQFSTSSSTIISNVLISEKAELEKSLSESISQIYSLTEKISSSEKQIETLTDALHEESSEKHQALNHLNLQRSKLSLLSAEQEKLKLQLNSALQKLASCSPKNHSRCLKRREEKINKLISLSDSLRSELNSVLLHSKI